MSNWPKSWTYYKLPRLDKCVKISNENSNDYFVVDLLNVINSGQPIDWVNEPPEEHKKIILKESRKYCEELNSLLKSFNS